MKRETELHSIEQTMQAIQIQIADSIDFAREWLGGVREPTKIWRMLKMSTTYKNDPRGVELLQTFQTMMLNNYHGIPGAGDCDCFTIAATACFLASNNRCEIILAGQYNDEYSHIYNRVFYGGNYTAFDLTQPIFGSERNYKYKKVFSVS